MARWRLTEAHYLKVEDCVWEEKVTDRMTGRQKRLSHPVPMHLDPKCHADWNYKPGQATIEQGGSGLEDGSIVVCHKDKGKPQDIVFFGDPTPAMEPLDDEAKEISAKFKWADPMNEFDTGMSYTEKMMLGLHEQMAAALSSKSERLAVDESPLMKQMSEVMAMLATSQAQTNALLAQLVSMNDRRA